MADPVQSIRVAQALLGRFPGLMRQASSTQSETELAIGEANQLYPEIWRHMDDARRVLAGRGRDTSTYDAFRAQVLAELGITDIDVRQVDWKNKWGVTVHTTHEKVVSFNYEGYQRALAASKALMAAMPEIDWDELARQDVRAIAEAGSLQTAKVKTIGKVVAGLAGLAAITYGIYWVISDGSDGVSDDDAAEMRARAAEQEKATAKRHDELDAKYARMDALKATVKATCEPAAITQLVSLMREEGQLSAAKKLETEPCLPERPACQPALGNTLDRLAAQYESVLAAPRLVMCRGARVGTPPKPALVVAFMDGKQMVRGIASPDGKTDIAPFEPGPGELLIDVADLDGDGADEIVFAGQFDAWITKLVNGALVDAKSPSIPKKCEATVAIERDVRRDPDSKNYRLVIRTFGDNCEASESIYKLAGDAVVED